MQKYKEDDVIQLTHNVRVISHNEDTVKVYDIDRKMSFDIIGQDLINSALSADYYPNGTVKLGKVALAELLTKSNGKILTVSFNKDCGEERTLRGIFQSSEPLMGRSYLVDVDKKDAHPRLVNHREINWIILDGIKYVKK